MDQQISLQLALDAYYIVSLVFQNHIFILLLLLLYIYKENIL